jgi:hypothetical protein
VTVAVRPAVRTRSVRCPECHTPRTVSLEQALRIQRGVHSSLCHLCRNPPKPRPVTERERRWWLIQAGVPKQAISRAGGAAPYVRAHGIPVELEAIVAGAAYLTSR